MMALLRARPRAFVLCVAIFVFLLISLGFFSAPATRRPLGTPDIGSGTSGGSSSSSPGGDPPPDSDIAIPRLIWQIFFAPPGIETIEKDAIYSSEWVTMAPGYTYTMLGTSEADAFVAANFGDKPDIAATYHALSNPGLKSDFLRYLLLYTRGGTYSDTDTKPVVPLERWLPQDKRRDAKLLVAIEYDEAQDPHPADFKYPVQFCQWTIAAAPKHIVFERMVQRAMTGLHDIASAQGTTLDKADIKDFDVLNTTGPVAWTEVVFETLQEYDETIRTYDDLARFKSPRYFSDIVVLPLSAFRADYLDDWGYSWRKGRTALVRHYFKGGWRKVKIPN
ncbi:nucleotide-diphospho-sugar transferase [Podospora didyma]|uniref:Nucleotide-diphospho-sugar transferase n=1 Tax=Podospora didyma TaxID=330526 RepID=A0AAE0NU32_9PEZI|nr:nucleotide-diphospho-sugar transferase [Podospora didyma]